MFEPAWLAGVAPGPEPGSEPGFGQPGAGLELDSGLEQSLLGLGSELGLFGLVSVGARRSAASVSLARWATAAPSAPQLYPP